MSNKYRHHVSLTETIRLLGLSQEHAQHSDRRWLFTDLPFPQQDRPTRKDGLCQSVHVLQLRKTQKQERFPPTLLEKMGTIA